jgi:hypothetical protein
VEEIKIRACAICGQERLADEPWFLVAEDSWADKLKVLHWNDFLATRAGVHCACSAAHVQELVVHWMTTGSLSYPFARTELGCRRAVHRGGIPLSGRLDAYTAGTRTIGELAVHRESMERLLLENPQSLNGILRALLSALEQESPRTAALPSTDGKELSSLAR